MCLLLGRRVWLWRTKRGQGGAQEKRARDWLLRPDSGLSSWKGSAGREKIPLEDPVGNKERVLSRSGLPFSQSKTSSQLLVGGVQVQKQEKNPNTSVDHNLMGWGYGCAQCN